ncbi:MAG: helix-hairpin-helix domain-containing protein [Bacteroidota bacterium]
MYFSRRQVLALAVALALTAAGGGVLVWRQAVRGAVTIEEPGGETRPVAAADKVVVHVCGAVKNPGVYILPAGSRVYEAIERAGGALPEADQEALNLAAFVRDGEQIRLPRKGESPPAAAPRATAAAAGEHGGAAAPRESAPRFPLHLNTATAADLQAVPGIGPALAARIVAYRKENGPFAEVDDLVHVPGIGARTLERFRPYLTVP